MHHFFIFWSLVLVACSSGSNKPVPADSVKPHTEIDRATQAVLTTATTVSVDSAVTSIRIAYQKINSTRLTEKQFKWTATNCNNEGTATYYLDDHNQIVKVVETGLIGDGTWTTAYYYEGGKFVFSLNTDIGGPAAGPDITTIQRKYVYNDTVVRTMENDTYTTGQKEVLTPASKEYKIVQAYQTKDFGAAFCE